MRDDHGVQTSLLYPSISEFEAYRDCGYDVPRSERFARTQVTIPLYPTLTEEDQDHVVSVLRESLAALQAERSLA